MFKINQRPISSAFRRSNGKTFSMRRENEVDKVMDDRLK